MRCSALLGAAALLLATPALADEPPIETDEDAAPFDTEVVKEPKSSLRWSGRVFARNTLTRQRLGGQTFWRNQQQVASARAGMRYRHKSGAQAVIKIEFEDDEPELKDGYIRLVPLSTLHVFVGRFKRPMSGIGLAGRWDLPSVERGLLDSRIEGQKLPFVGGRGNGAVVQYKAPVAAKLRLSAGLFQNSLGTGSSSLDAADHFAQDVYLRASVEPVEDLQLASSFGLFGYLGEVGDPDSFSHAPVGSVEVVYDPSWLRLWAEGFTGKSMFAKADGSTSGNFLGARILVAPNLRTGVPRRLQPFAGLSYFDPRFSENEDANTEVQGGVNLAFSKIWRLQLELTHSFAQGIASSAIEGTAFRVQLGARFKE